MKRAGDVANVYVPSHAQATFVSYRHPLRYKGDDRPSEIVLCFNHAWYTVLCRDAVQGRTTYAKLQVASSDWKSVGFQGPAPTKYMRLGKEDA